LGVLVRAIGVARARLAKMGEARDAYEGHVRAVGDDLLAAPAVGAIGVAKIRADLAAHMGHAEARLAVIGPLAGFAKASGAFLAGGTHIIGHLGRPTIDLSVFAADVRGRIWHPNGVDPEIYASDVARKPAV
jgi:hypothetical protein